MDAYAKTKSSDAGINAERIFKQLEKAYTNGNLNAKPNVHSFNTVMNAWVQSGKGGIGALRAEEILRKMISLSKYDDEIKPNVVSFTTVIHGWAKSGEVGSAKRAQRIFDFMTEQYESGNNRNAKPNAITYSTLMNAWIKDGSPKNAERVLDHLESSFRNNGKDNKINGQYVYQNIEMKPVRPNTIHITQIMDAWSKSGVANAGEKATSLLTRLESLHRDYANDETMKPNALTYTATINAWAKSRQFHKGKKARETLHRMIQAYKGGNRDAKPNVFAFTSVLNACAFTIGDVYEKKEALEIASATFRDLIASPEYGFPNHITYITFLRVCSNLIPEESSNRISTIASVFQKCCQDGQVNDSVLRLLENILLPEELNKLVGPCKMDSNGNWKVCSIPKEWKHNVRDTKKRLSKRTNTGRKTLLS